MPVFFMLKIIKINKFPIEVHFNFNFQRELRYRVIYDTPTFYKETYNRHRLRSLDFHLVKNSATPIFI